MNMKKIGLTALAASLVSFSANAGELTVTGAASVSVAGYSAEMGNNPKSFTMGNQFTVSGGGELDNGLNVAYSMQVDQGVPIDDHSVTVSSEDMGTLVFAGHGGSSAMGAVDDVMPTASQEPWDLATGAEADVIGGGGGNNMFTYSYAHDSGLNVTASYTNAADAVTDVSYSDIGVSYSGVDGLLVGYAQGDVEVTTNTKKEQNTMYATYAMGGITVGIQVSENDQSGSTNDRDSTGMGISYQVSDDLAVSYGSHNIEYDNTTLDDQESTAVSVSYTMGSLGIKAAMTSVDNIAGAATNDREAYELALSFAF